MSWIGFEKWEGLRNDFIVVESRDLSPDEAVRAAPQLCDRRSGVGADGVLVVDREPARMVVVNADGSRPEMCGNGIRCVAGWLAERGLNVETILSDAGPRAVKLIGQSSGAVDVSVEMGVPSYAFEAAGVDAEPCGSEAGASYLEAELGRGFVVSVGNPHWVFFGEAPVDLASLGPAHERDSRFGARTNVEWVVEEPDGSLRVDVWERGCGITEACGTGATAVGALWSRLRGLSANTPLRVVLPGGPLEIRVDDEGRAWMTGPARRAFRGEFKL